MRVGTRSILFGAHQFLLHPWFVAAAWWQLFGFPWDTRLWVAFFVHDLGYWGKRNMDGPEGEYHVVLGARIMSFLFDRTVFRRLDRERCAYLTVVRRSCNSKRSAVLGRWGQFSLFHSRFFALLQASATSRLCVADKLAIALEPWWLYLPRVKLTGELREYMLGSTHNNETADRFKAADTSWREARAWHAEMCAYIRRYVDAHKDGQAGTWTRSRPGAAV